MMTSKPALSVVVPSVNGLGSLGECLEALRSCADAGPRLQILVVDRCGPPVPRAVSERFPDVEIISAPPETSIPRLRAIGFARATADAVAVIEDHVLVPPDWSTRLLDALAAGHDVVGGSVRNAANARAVDRAAFLCEYSHVIAPLPSGSVETLTGNNVVYRRSLLNRYAAVVAGGGWEDQLHAALRRDGVPLTCVPDIFVSHKMHYRVRDYMSQRFLYARSYAGVRRAAMNGGTRVAFAIAALGLPPVLLGRIVTRVWAKPGHRGELAASLPLLPLFVCAWAAGEAVGYLAGPGAALARVK